MPSVILYGCPEDLCGGGGCASKAETLPFLPPLSEAGHVDLSMAWLSILSRQLQVCVT